MGTTEQPNEAPPVDDRPRVEQTRSSATVTASPDRCFDVATDLEAYPEWAMGVTHAEVLDRDDLGRPLRAAFRAEAMGRYTSYTLDYDHRHAPEVLSWSLVWGDLARGLTGAYSFEPSLDTPGATDVTYELTVDLAVPLPGFVKRRAETKIVAAALERFRRRVEETG